MDAREFIMDTQRTYTTAALGLGLIVLGLVLVLS